MKMEDLKGKSRDELKAMILERKKELFNLRFQQASGELENTARFSVVRKEVARLMTALSAQAKQAA